MIDAKTFGQLIPTNKEADEWHSLAVEFWPQYDINTENRIAGFMAQTGHESLDFTRIHENMNYSWESLRRVFPRYYPTTASAKAHHRKPVEIANHVYDDANRINKIGNTQPGDGWRFRGRGLIQNSGRWNFHDFGKTKGMTAEEAAAYCGTKQGAFEVACWFWKENNINRFCDADDIVGMSKAINGGKIGLDDRIKRYERAKQLIDMSEDVSKEVCNSEPARVLKRGSRGEVVKAVQSKLKLVADGIYGKNTERAVRSWQRSHGERVTGKLTNAQIVKILV